MTDIYYKINGVNFGDASFNAMGWVIKRLGTTALAGITKALTKVTAPGYDGYFSGPSVRTEQTVIFNITTPRENLEALFSVLAHVGYDTDFPTRGVIEIESVSDQAAYFELVSAIPASTFPSDAFVTVTATLNIPYGGWRDKDTTVTTESIASSPTSFTVAPGMSLPISDADVFIQGDVGTMQITDSAGSWLRTTDAYAFSTGYGIFYQGSTGRAFSATEADPWTPVADLGFAVDVSGGGFKMTPKFTPTTPDTRSAELTVLSTNTSSVSVKVRWRGAYVMK